MGIKNWPYRKVDFNEFWLLVCAVDLNHPESQIKSKEKLLFQEKNRSRNQLLKNETWKHWKLVQFDASNRADENNLVIIAPEVHALKHIFDLTENHTCIPSTICTTSSQLHESLTQAASHATSPSPPQAFEAHRQGALEPPNAAFHGGGSGSSSFRQWTFAADTGASDGGEGSGGGWSQPRPSDEPAAAAAAMSVHATLHAPLPPLPPADDPFHADWPHW